MNTPPALLSVCCLLAVVGLAGCAAPSRPAAVKSPAASPIRPAVAPTPTPVARPAPTPVAAQAAPAAAATPTQTTPAASPPAPVAVAAVTPPASTPPPPAPVAVVTPPSPPRPAPVAVAAAAAANSAVPLGDYVVVDDSFDDGDPTGSKANPRFWNLQAITGDNGVFENDGYLTLFAVKAPYTFAGMNTVLDERLNFFTHTVAVTVEDMVLEGKALPEGQDVFRVSLNSTEKRQNMSPQSVSVRFVGERVIFGYKTNHVELVGAEDLTGTTKGSPIFEQYDGKVKGFRLTLDPYADPGYITATLVILTDGSRPRISRTARLNLKVTDWSSGGKSALHLESRRNVGVEAEDSYMSAAIGRLTITTTKR